MTDLRETVARAILTRYTHPKHKTESAIDLSWSILERERPEKVSDLLAMADAAIAAIEPEIRRDERERVFAELANEMDGRSAEAEEHGAQQAAVTYARMWNLFAQRYQRARQETDRD